MKQLACIFVLLGMVSAQADVTFDWATIGDVGNEADSTGYGAVAHEYKIATTEVSLVQYTEFLNAVDSNGLNALALYNANMGSNANIAGIAFDSGAASGSKYSVLGSGLRPVTYVSAYDAMRFVNWLHNGQGSGGTETGAYTISSGGITSASRTGNVATITLGAASTLGVGDQVTVSGVSNGAFNGTFVVTGVSGSTFTYVTSDSGSASGTGGTHIGASATHVAEAAFWLPTEDEWYKAAYYDPTKGGGGGYWLYPTQNNTLAGNLIGEANSANYVATFGDDEYFAKETNDLPSYLTDGGAYGTNSASYYETQDQGGNVWEWNEAVVNESSRGLRGGSWDDTAYYMRSSYRYDYAPTFEFDNIGFRVAAIPEPSTVAMLIIAGAALLARWHRKDSRKPKRCTFN